jgi:protein kinase C substrate 80K-H
LFKSLESHSELLESLLVLHKTQRQRLDALEDILSSLRTGYNPNYQDMAVLEAVRGWEQIAGLPHINDVKKDEAEGGEEPLPFDDQSGISDEETQHKVEGILKTNRVSLLMEHDKYVDQAQVSLIREILSPASFVHLLTCCSVSNISSYIPHFFAPAFDYIRSFASTILGYSPPPTDAAEVSRVRQSLSDAETALREAEDEFKNAQRDLEDLFKPDRFGQDGEWKKLDKLCLEKDTGEYVLPSTVGYTVSYLSLGTHTRFASLGKRDKRQMQVALRTPSATSLPGRRMRKLARLDTILAKYLPAVPSVGMVHSAAYEYVLLTLVLALALICL